MKKLIPKYQDGNTYLGINQTTGTPQLPEVVIKPDRYFVKYDEEGNPIYTSDYNLSQQANQPSSTQEELNRKQQLTNIKNRPAGKLTGTAKVASDVAVGGIGASLTPLVASHLIPYTLPVLNSMSQPITTATKFASRFYPQARWLVPEVKYFENLGAGVVGASNLLDDVTDYSNNKISNLEFIGKSLIDLPLLGKGEFAFMRGLENPNHTIRTIHDFIKDFKPTMRAIKDGRYVNNFRSLLQNMRRVESAVQSGINNATSHLESLSGVKARSPKFKISHVPNARGDFNPKTKLIRVDPFYEKSNEAILNQEASFTGGHERTHDFLDFTDELRRTPSLSIKGGSYYVPNTENPIAKKYADEFLKASKIHGRSPEETYANYVGFKAAEVDGDFNKFNSVKERFKTPETFVSDYEDYLSHGWRFE